MPQAARYTTKVREQFEDFPYPLRDPADEKKRFILSPFARLDMVSHHCFRGEQDFTNFRVLAAGGGTGDGAIAWAEQLRGRKGSGVVYLDNRVKSADIAKKRAKARGLDNIEWVTDALTNAHKLGLGKFDFIDCTGVLHGADDPEAALKALASALKPGGAMHISVHAPYGRAAAYQLQDLMRLVNGGRKELRRKVENAKAVVKSLPPHHWLNVSRQIGWTYSDLESDAGIYEMLLHPQDRPFTILEVHDLLESCGLRMTSEPGARYIQTHYMPETFVRNEDLLKQIAEYPLKIRHAIGEAISTQIVSHQFYAVHEDAKETVADVSNSALIPWAGMTEYVPFEKLSKIAEKREDDFTVTLDTVPGKPSVSVPKGRLMPALLRAIDGKRTVAQVIDAVIKDKQFKSRPPAKATVATAFEKLFTSLNRGHALFLRHKSTAPFPPMYELESRVKDKK